LNLRKYKQSLLAIGAMLLIVAAAAVIIVVVLQRVFPDLMRLLEQGSEGEIEAYIRGAGAGGVLIIFFLQYLQVLSIMLPGMPVQIAAGIVYGALRGYLICESAFLAGNLTALCIARRLGSGRIRQLLGKQEGKARFLENTQYPVFMVIIASMVPVVPNGIIPYGAAISGMSVRDFSSGVLLGSSSGILIFCAVGSHLLAGNYVPAVLLCGLQIAVIVVMMKYRNNIIGWYARARARLRHSAPEDK